MTPHQVANVYRRQQIESATPAQLIAMLYDATIRNCRSARQAIEQHDRDRAARSLLKAQDIVAELMGSLDVEAGGNLGAALLQLYEYLYRRLVQANVRKDVQAVEEAERLLTDLHQTWVQAMESMPAEPIRERAAETAG